MHPRDANTLRDMIDAAIDHVAIAVRSIRTAIPLYSDALGATFLFAGEQPGQGFRWAQFRFPGGGKIEFVTPLGPNSFVARFLERRGEGVHHVTLKVPSIERALEQLGARGVPLFNVSTDRRDWKEAFIHPRDAAGALIQVVQSAFSDDEVARHHLAPHPDDGHQHISPEDLLSEPPDGMPERART